MSKHYIGDGCYVEFNGSEFVITTGDGIRITNRIVFDCQILENFQEYVRRVEELGI